MLIYKAIVFLPLIGALIAGLFGRQIGAKASEYITSGLMIIVAVLSWIVFINVGFGGIRSGVLNLADLYVTAAAALIVVSYMAAREKRNI